MEINIDTSKDEDFLHPIQDGGDRPSLFLDLLLEQDSDHSEEGSEIPFPEEFTYKLLERIFGPGSMGSSEGIKDSN
jgi:hypothetical protein